MSTNPSILLWKLWYIMEGGNIWTSPLKRSGWVTVCRNTIKWGDDSCAVSLFWWGSCSPLMTNSEEWSACPFLAQGNTPPVHFRTTASAKKKKKKIVRIADRNENNVQLLCKNIKKFKSLSLFSLVSVWNCLRETVLSLGEENLWHNANC